MKVSHSMCGSRGDSDVFLAQ